MTEQILTRLDHAFARGAVRLNRRRFIRAAGGTAFGATAAATLWWPRRARANHCIINDTPYSSDRICGPSGYCNDTRCYTSGACHNTCNTRPRHYEGVSCLTDAPANHGNCWCVCSSGHNKYNCCDCCADTYQSGISYCCNGGGCPGGGCGSNPGLCDGRYWYRCVCKGLVCSNCC